MSKTTSLNGTWLIDWLSEQPYTAQEEPAFFPDSESCTPCPVPGYWEDLTALFRTTALHTKLHWNPKYTLQEYPQAGYVPDMALPNPVGCFVYRRTVTLTQLPAGETELYFGGVQNAASAWINGHFLGRHEGYSTDFSFPIQDGVLVAGENRITLVVSNNRLAGYKGRPVSGLTSRAANECTGGIWGDVALRSYADGLKDVWVSTEADCTGFTVHTAGGTDKEKTVQIYDGDKLLRTAQIPAGEDCCLLSADGLALWSPDAPKLYTASVLTAGQRIDVRFGIRRLTVEGTKLFLNGKPYFFRGTCEHCYQPLTVHPTRQKRYYRMVIRKLKELGFNSIRFHTWVPPQEYMEAADELGIVMEIESPNNTAYNEWEQIVRFCRKHAAVNMYSTGNELQIDFDYEAHLEACAGLVHSQTDSLFSPMSAMRGIEYDFENDPTVPEPFEHNPTRLAAVGKYCDVYNSYSNSMTSYDNTLGTREILDTNNAVYGKPLLSHEICIQGTYIDLALEERYKGSRIGDTRLMSSVRQHLEEKGLLDKANLYYRNSAAWQRTIRKYCFETVRLCESFAGYDFLGDIDTHWHTFGYCVGMMNEFYELKAGETVENVRRYNSDVVLLAELPTPISYANHKLVDRPSPVNCVAGTTVQIPLLVSNYAEPLSNAQLQIRVNGGGKVLLRKQLRIGQIPAGAITPLHTLSFRVPKVEKPMAMTLTVTLSGGNTDCENCWQLYAFPKTAAPTSKQLKQNHITVLQDCDGTTLLNKLKSGGNVVLFGLGPFASSYVHWQMSLAGRTNGHLATVIADHPIMADFPHDGYCGRQFETMLTESRSALLDLPELPHDPIIDIASSYKNAHREGMLFEYKVGNGKLLVCTLRLSDVDPAAQWLKNRILTYAASAEFAPAQTLTDQQFATLCKASPVISQGNANAAKNLNDITM